MYNSKTVTGIILIAGNSTRYGKNVNKNFEKINNKTVIEYSIDIFNNNNNIDNIIIVLKQKDKEQLKEILTKIKTKKSIKLIIGGNSRQESVYNALKECNSDFVLIHDGARPLIKQDYITSLLKEMEKYKGVTLGVKTKDTIKITDQNNVVKNTTERNNTWLIQTPQCFNKAILCNLYQEYKDYEITDDCMLLEKGKYEVKIIQGDYKNIKITTPEDIDIVRLFINE